jgi:peptidyl-prolyl cis-trans isomerase A (cyclophilin A)
MLAFIQTPLGQIDLQLALEDAPVTAGYFQELIQAGALDGSSFFRIVGEDNASMRSDNPIVVVQGGLTEKDPQPIAPVRHEPTSETGLKHKKWTLSAARFGPGETYASFFICMRDEPSLDAGGARHPDGLGFAAFGQVTGGFDVVSAIFERREKTEYLKRPITISRCALAGPA